MVLKKEKTHDKHLSEDCDPKVHLSCVVLVLSAIPVGIFGGKNNKTRKLCGKSLVSHGKSQMFEFFKCDPASP